MRATLDLFGSVKKFRVLYQNFARPRLEVAWEATYRMPNAGGAIQDAFPLKPTDDTIPDRIRDRRAFVANVWYQPRLLVWGEALAPLQPLLIE